MKLLSLDWLAWDVVWSSSFGGSTSSSRRLERSSRASWEVTRYSTNTSSSSGIIESLVLELRRRNTRFFSTILLMPNLETNCGGKGNPRVGMILSSNTRLRNIEQVKPRDSRLLTLRKHRRYFRISTGSSVILVDWRVSILGTLTFFLAVHLTRFEGLRSNHPSKLSYRVRRFLRLMIKTKHYEEVLYKSYK